MVSFSFWLKAHKKDLLLSLLSFLFFGTLLLAIGLLVQWPSDARWQVPSTQFDSELGWASIPGQTFKHPDGSTITYNEQGYRSPPYETGSEAILLVGDSITFGTGVSNGETMSDFLAARTHPIPVLNLGIPGYGIDQYYLTLSRHIEETQPTVIFVVLFPGNDRRNTTHDTQYGKRKPLYRMVEGKLVLSGVPIPKDACINNFTTSAFMKLMRAVPIAGFYGHLESMGLDYCGTIALEDEEGREVIVSLLRRIEELGSSHGAQTHFLLTPSLSDLTQESEEMLYFKQLLSEENIPFTDLSTTIAQEEDPASLYFDGVHYSAAGNEVVADAMYSLISPDN